MAAGLIDLDTAGFDAQVKSGITLVDFWAPWCGPCRMQTPILERLAPQVAGRAVIAKVNVDENQDLAVRYNVMSIPTILLFKDGKLVQQFVAVQPEAKLLSAIESAEAMESGVAMPIFEYTCAECGRTAEILQRRRNERPACPECGSRRMRKQLSAFSAGAARAPSPCASGACSLAGGGCPSVGACPGGMCGLS